MHEPSPATPSDGAGDSAPRGPADPAALLPATGAAAAPPPAAPSRESVEVARRIQLRKMQERHERDVASYVLDYAQIVWRRRWLIAGFTALVVALVAVKTLRTPKLYKAFAKISVDQSGGSAIPGVDQNNNYYKFRGFLARQIEVLKSRSLARTVIEELNLADHPQFRGLMETPESYRRGREMTRGTVEHIAREALGTEAIEPPGPGETPERRPDRALVGVLRGMIDIQEDEERNNIITITCTSAYPDLASRVPNAIASTYRKMSEAEARDRNDSDRAFLLEKLEQTETKLAAAETALQDYSTKEGLVALDKQVEEAGRALANYTTQEAEAKRALLAAEARHEQMTKDPETALTIRADESVVELRTELQRLRREFAEKSGLFKPEYPEMKDLARRIELLEEQYQAEIGAAVASAAAELRTAERHLESVLQEIDKRIRFYDAIKEKVGRHERLREEVNKSTDLRNQLIEGLAMTTVRQGAAIVDVHIIDPAETPTAPFYPRTSRNLAVGLLAGLVVGMMFAFALEFMDNTVKSAEEVEEFIHLPALASIPLHGVGLPQRPRREAAGTPGTVELVSYDEPRGLYAEKFRFLRTAITYSTPGGNPRVLAFSSCLPKEGKTTVSINTAITFARRGMKVVLVDCDLKKPMVHKHMGLERQVGLTTVLTNNADVDDVIQHSQVEGLDIITAGHLPPNPTELIDSPQMREVIDTLRARYDLVVFDSAPLYNIPDSNVLATYMEGLILVVRAGSTPRDVLREVHEQLASLQVRVVGVVVNRVDSASRTTYGKYGYGAKYGYGYNYAYGYGGRGAAEEPVKMKRDATNGATRTGDRLGENAAGDKGDTEVASATLPGKSTRRAT